MSFFRVHVNSRPGSSILEHPFHVYQSRKINCISSSLKSSATRSATASALAHRTPLHHLFGCKEHRTPFLHLFLLIALPLALPLVVFHASLFFFTSSFFHSFFLHSSFFHSSLPDIVEPLVIA